MLKLSKDNHFPFPERKNGKIVEKSIAMVKIEAHTKKFNLVHEQKNMATPVV
jgi:hypothetical protein